MPWRLGPCRASFSRIRLRNMMARSGRVCFTSATYLNEEAGAYGVGLPSRRDFLVMLLTATTMLVARSGRAPASTVGVRTAEQIWTLLEADLKTDFIKEVMDEDR